MTDGLTRTVPAGGTVSLAPGESITIPQYCYHAFWAKESRTLVGEVSLVNDDTTDNRFYEELARFSQVEEDDVPFRLLVSDYA
jgi:D-lyxose ketol-isomerase